jgi:hypothetical protein
MDGWMDGWMMERMCVTEQVEGRNASAEISKKVVCILG